MDTPDPAPKALIVPSNEPTLDICRSNVLDDDVAAYCAQEYPPVVMKEME